MSILRAVYRYAIERVNDMKDDLFKEQRSYAWNYFQIHATQRMTTFNFFVILAGLLTAGLAKTLTAEGDMHIISLLLGVGLIVISFAFWRLDNRVRGLIHLAESKLIDIEKKLQEEDIGWTAVIFMEEHAERINNKGTYTSCYFIIYLTFAVLGCFGIVGYIVSIL